MCTKTFIPRLLIHPLGFCIRVLVLSLIALISLIPLIAPAQQPLLQIASPSSGTIVNPGQTLSVSVTSPAGATFAQVDVIGEAPIGISAVGSSLPAQFSLAIPSDIACGQYRLTAEGTTTTGQDAESASIIIDVERPDLPVWLSSLSSGIFLQQPSQKIPLIVMAMFADGTILDVTGSSYVSYTSGNTGVATVDQYGMVTAVAPGSGYIKVAYSVGGKSIQASVPVSFPVTGGTATSNFILSITPGTQTVVAGASTNFTVSSSSYTGFSGSITLAASGLPSGGTASFSPTSINAPGSSTLTVSTLQTTPVGTNTLIVSGTSSNLNPSVSALLTVAAPGSGPTITSLSPTSGPVGTSVTISGTNFGSSQGTSTVTFNGTTATPTGWSATSITAPVPSGAATGSVVVTVGGVASNGVSFTVITPPNITSLTPTIGPIGTLVTIAGTNFGSSQGTSTVTFNGTTATPTSWSATSIVAPVPSGATTGNVVVTVGGVASNGVSFTVSSVAFVQGNSQSTTSTTLISTYFPSTLQTIGDLNIVVIACYDACQISSVKDTNGNSYTPAVGPTTFTSGGVTLLQAIYYANVGSNAQADFVTVVFKKTTARAELQIAEYGGLNTTNPVDVTAADSAIIPCTLVGGTCTFAKPANSGSATTTNAHDLLVAADTTTVVTTGAGTGFTTRLITPSSYANLLEDEEVTVKGTYSATAPLQPPPGMTAGSALFVMQMVALRAAH